VTVFDGAVVVLVVEFVGVDVFDIV